MLLYDFFNALTVEIIVEALYNEKNTIVKTEV